MRGAGLILAAAASVRAACDWKNVHTGGGGGFVASIQFHPTEKGVAFARTDIGGLYRLNDDDSWTPVTDANGFAHDDNWNRWGIDALALDPSDANNVYIAAGMYTNDWYCSSLYALCGMASLLIVLGTPTMGPLPAALTRARPGR